MIRIYVFVFGIFFLLSCQTKQNEKESSEKKIKVAVFNGNGASATCILESLEALKIDSGIIAEEISAWQIQNGKLSEFDAILFPGGSGSKELLDLGEQGKQKIHEFIEKQGGGIIGICAGGYLLSKTPTYPSLELANAMNIDRQHYERGRGLVEFKLSSKGESYFPELQNHKLFLQYFDGPILQPIDSIARYDELATYLTDIHVNTGTPQGITPNKGFMLTQKIGKGKLVIVAGHPEATPGMRWMVPRMARIVTNSNQISYNQKWVRPEINNKEILFTSDLKKAEELYFWKLLNDTVTVQLQAMDSLFALRSRPAVRWYVGLLRNNKAEIRKKAAFLLAETEYTDALNDLKAAWRLETDNETKKIMKASIDRLNYK
jgi:glutamine amidotransferase-like uncharacterized protein